jgi:hypothetical protein
MNGKLSALPLAVIAHKVIRGRRIRAKIAPVGR